MGKVGNVFSPSQIDKAIELGEQFKDRPINPYCIHSIGVDPGFSSSSTGIVVTEFLQEEKKIRVVYAEAFERANPTDLVNLIFKLYLDHGIDNTFVFCDAANTGFVSLLKVAFSESLNWQKSQTRISPETMKILPISFGSTHREMLSHLALLVSKEYLCIPASMTKLEVALRTA